MLSRIAFLAALAIAIPVASSAQAVFGNGSDGAVNLTASDANLSTPDAAITASAPVGSSTIQVDSTSGFTPGTDVLLINYQGTGAGAWETVTVQSVGANSLTLTAPTTKAFGQGIEARAIKIWRFSSINVGSGRILTSSSRVLAMRSAGTCTVAGGIHANARGFPGGGVLPGGDGQQGTSFNGAGTANTTNNQGGGGGGEGGTATGAGAGGGGSYGTAGTNGTTNNSNVGGTAGTVYGLTFPTEIYLGSGGGGGGGVLSGMTEGGWGGGIVMIFAPTIAVTPGGVIASLGEDGEDGTDSFISGKSGAGGGSGGSIYLYTSSTSGLSNGGVIAALGGARGELVGSAGASVGFGGNGGSGRIHVAGPLTGAGTITPAPSTGPGEPPLAEARAWQAYE